MTKIMTWQERGPHYEACDQQDAMQAEIDELRAALAAKPQEPWAKTLLDDKAAFESARPHGPVTDDDVSEAVRAYVQAGKRGEDLLGAMRCAIEASRRCDAAPAAVPEISDERIIELAYKFLPTWDQDTMKFARAVLAEAIRGRGK